MTVRTVSRAAVLTGVLTALLALSTSPAFASARIQDDGQQSGAGLSVLETLGLFVLAPAALFVVISLLAAAPGMTKGPRYRPGSGWWAAPVWFNGPTDAERAVRDTVATNEGGGASARW